MDNFLTNHYFNPKFNAIAKELPFNKEWSNGTGYYDGAAVGPDAVKLKPGEEAKSHDKDTDRKLIFIGTSMGTIVVFQRYSAGQDDVYTYNAPTEIEHLGLLQSRLEDIHLQRLLRGNHRKSYSGNENFQAILEDLRRKLSVVMIQAEV